MNDDKRRQLEEAFADHLGVPLKDVNVNALRTLPDMVFRGVVMTMEKNTMPAVSAQARINELEQDSSSSGATGFPSLSARKRMGER